MEGLERMDLGVGGVGGQHGQTGRKGTTAAGSERVALRPGVRECVSGSQRELDRGVGAVAGRRIEQARTDTAILKLSCGRRRTLDMHVLAV